LPNQTTISAFLSQSVDKLFQLGKFLVSFLISLENNYLHVYSVLVLENLIKRVKNNDCITSSNQKTGTMVQLIQRYAMQAVTMISVYSSPDVNLQVG